MSLESSLYVFRGCPKSKYVCCRFRALKNGLKNFLNLSENVLVVLNLKRSSGIDISLKVLFLGVIFCL